MLERREVAQRQVVLALDPVLLADGGEDLGPKQNKCWKPVVCILWVRNGMRRVELTGSCGGVVGDMVMRELRVFSSVSKMI